MSDQNIFEKKESRADIRYIPQVKDLKDVMYLPELTTKEAREGFADRLEKYIQ